MQNFLITLGYGFGALLALAFAVAGWEHWRRSQQARGPQVAPEAAAVRAAHVDVDLTAGPQQAGQQDQAERKTTVDAALARMALAGSSSGPTTVSSAWIETRPMVGLGIAQETEPH